MPGYNQQYGYFGLYNPQPSYQMQPQQSQNLWGRIDTFISNIADRNREWHRNSCGEHCQAYPPSCDSASCKPPYTREPENWGTIKKEFSDDPLFGGVYRKIRGR